ncbi:hypothetical protein [Nevskia sp.]|uniref:hypothetical protein n=1 Tax=Nevskia sp. TaxID=1929292 RepID=UPI0025F99783|nr:hypothetical protein [Nevskia sp.]
MQTPDTQPGAYFVTARSDDGATFWPMLGPFVNDHAAALAMVDKARDKATEIDPRAWWMAWGTTRLDADHPAAAKPGRLNPLFP